jgi:hypothetical protein
MNSKIRNKPQVVKTSAPIYGLGFVGAIIYFFQQAETFGEWVLGFLEALVWPAILVHELFEFLKF